MQWSIRNLLNPVITRCLIYGANPFDMEYVLRKMEEKPLLNARMLDDTWMSEWEKKAQHFISLADEESRKDNMVSVSEYYSLAASCYYACYLLNSDAIEKKKGIYEKLASTYEQFLTASERQVEAVKITFGEKKYLPAYLHFPDKNKYEGPYPCVIMFTGMGSCKEEMEIEAKPLIDRGIAVLAMDMPGTGNALFQYDIKLSAENTEKAIDQILSFCKENPLIDNGKLGTYGLCMGGGFAYRAAAKHTQIQCCVSLFPLFLSMVEPDNIPRWMKQGQWAAFQMDKPVEQFLDEMEIIGEGCINCDFLLVHSVYDNWMELEKTKLIYEKSQGAKQEIEIEEQPVYATKESVMHAMPVGEQMHWIKRKAADFCAQALRK
ncbi:alpha/beta hydrolase [[Clostridium] polysaccharolyticum]|uniref:Alpha/beta hydrolase family protein n=1 Tax=[Clostridium] polysaccharolyticum TaxID=29364 RepID=A0A1I0A8U2_9FIRM|nr:alpha/beta hydrolase [[Clostridium] polysaccharolyticum]SES90569.1 Alpha/beta hydrolase of unknown function [[Clostridium] polysaccharolyticum]